MLYTDDNVNEELEPEASNIESTKVEATKDFVEYSDFEGQSFRFQFQAYIDGSRSIMSNIITVVIATVPATPSTKPRVYTPYTTATQLGVEIDEIASIGEAVIIGYEIQRDDGKGGSFYTVAGGHNSPSIALIYTITQNIERGLAYRFKYRAQNIAGWSAWSPVASLSASTVPSAPPKPTYVSSTDSQISLAFGRTRDNGGSIITEYELSVDNGEQLVSTCAYTISTFACTVDLTQTYSNDVSGTSVTWHSPSSPYLVTGGTFHFSYKAVNSIGNSEWSLPTSVAFGPLPVSVPTPVRDATGNSPTSIGVTWTEMTGQTLAILEYILYVNDGSQVEDTEVYRGSENSFVMTNTNPSSYYTFTLKARNFNGESDEITSSPIIS